MDNPLHILLADDHKLFRRALKKLMEEFSVTMKVYEASNGREVMEMLETETIDLILLDVQMPLMGGIEVLKSVRQQGRETNIIMLTQFDDESLIIYLLQLGANCFLLKDCEPLELEIAISTVVREGYYYNERVLHAIEHNLSKEKKLSNLNITAREFQVMVLLKEGKSNKEVARNLGLTLRTVESYRKSLIKKTNCRNTADLISLAYRTGIMPHTENSRVARNLD